MAISLTIPRLQMSMTEGTLVEWLVAHGTIVKKGDPIYVLETDKSSLEIESPADGRLMHGREAGETLDVGTAIGEIA